MYLLDGTKIADGFLDMWDAALYSPINIDQFGVPRNPNLYEWAFGVWTGSRSDGTAFPSSDLIIGGSYPELGRFNELNLDWIEAFANPSATKPYPLYALSSEISVPAAIDIKPGSDPNSINPKSKGVVPVAVLGSIDFDATQIDFSTVSFGPDGASTAHDGHVEDVNDDGYMDMVFHFKTQETGIACGDPDATLTGKTTGGTQFTGTDTVKTVGCKGSNQDTSVKGAGTMSWLFLVGLSVLGLWRRNRLRDRC